MHPIMKRIDGFTVAGVSVTTKNSDEFKQETAKLPKLWQQFRAGNPEINSAIFGVYSDYESDVNGSYSVTVGVIPDNHDTKVHTVKVNSGNYLVFQGKGAMPQAVIETWGRVWDYFTTESSQQRCFKTDFEAYGNDNEISIYIGVC